MITDCLSFSSSEDICCVRVHYWKVDHAHLFHCLIKTLIRVLHQESWSVSFCAFRPRNDKVSQYCWKKCHTSRNENTEIRYFSCFQCWSSLISPFVRGLSFIRWCSSGRLFSDEDRVDWSVQVALLGIHELCSWVHRTHLFSQFHPLTVSFIMCHASLLASNTGMSAATKYLPHRSRFEGFCFTRIEQRFAVVKFLVSGGSWPHASSHSVHELLATSLCVVGLVPASRIDFHHCLADVPACWRSSQVCRRLLATLILGHLFRPSHSFCTATPVFLAFDTCPSPCLHPWLSCGRWHNRSHHKRQCVLSRTQLVKTNRNRRGP